MGANIREVAIDAANKIAADPKFTQEFSVFRREGELIRLIKHWVHTWAPINRQVRHGIIDQHRLLRLANCEMAQNCRIVIANSWEGASTKLSVQGTDGRRSDINIRQA